MLKFVPVKYNELGENFSEDTSLAGYVGYDLSDNNRECGKCVFRLNGYSMEILYVDSYDNDPETIEGLIRSALNFGGNRSVYIAEYKAENGLDVAITLGFEENKGVYSGDIPSLLQGSCCMTGYGRHQQTVDSMNITVEIKSVNHRYFDFSSRTPRIYGFLDEKLKSFVQSKVARGKIECYVQVDNLEDDSVIVEINHSLAKGYVEAFKSLAETYEIDNNLNTGILARFNDVLLIRKEEADEGKIWDAVKAVAEVAVDKFISMRMVEGEKLRDDICSRADTILKNVEYVESRSPETVKEYTQKLLVRMNDVLGSVNIDEARILTEAAIYADKIAVAEETVRLRSHLEQLKGFFESEEAIGRKMDFLVQEINREANTIGSKACDVEIARCVLDIKSEVEKIREQVQNIE